MKDWHFIERLNQYIDGELPREDVQRLEAELQSDPGKMALYRQYLRLERGSLALARALESEALQPKVDLERNVIWVPKVVTPRRQRPAFSGFGWRLAFGGLGAAAAAGVAVFVFPGMLGLAPAPAGSTGGALASIETSEEAVKPTLASARVRRVLPHYSGWGQMVVVDMPSEVPEMPANLPVPPSEPPSLRVMDGTLPVFHGGRGSFTPATVQASFAAYEFQR